MRTAWLRPSRLYLAASLLTAIATALLLRAYVSSVSAAGAAAGPSVSVVMAAADIARGEPIQASLLRVRRIPHAYAPPGAVRQASQAAGRVALAGLSEGEVVTETRLARVRAGPVASLVPAGFRAFAVPTSLPRGAVDAGDHVDVLATYSSGQPHTETVVSAVEVLLVLAPEAGGAAAGPIEVGVAEGSSSTLVVLVSPEQQERLAFARAFADLTVSIAPAEPQESPP